MESSDSFDDALTLLRKTMTGFDEFPVPFGYLVPIGQSVYLPPVVRPRPRVSGVSGVQLLRGLRGIPRGCSGNRWLARSDSGPRRVVRKSTGSSALIAADRRRHVRLHRLRRIRSTRRGRHPLDAWTFHSHSAVAAIGQSPSVSPPALPRDSTPSDRTPVSHWARRTALAAI